MEKNIHNRLLIELAEKELISLYVSDVVKKEVINNFEKKLKEHYEEIQKGENKITKMLRPMDRPPIEWKQTVEEYVAKLEERFQELEDYGIMEFIPFSNDMLPELVERSIKRTKPFTEKKMEFRDAIIWFSYVDLLNYRIHLKNAYFITSNTTDFTENGKIHPDLQRDCTKFIFYKTPQDFIQNCEEVKQLQKTLKLVQWVEDEDLAASPNMVLNMIESRSFDYIFFDCLDYIGDYRNHVPTKFDPDADYLEATDISLLKVTDLNVEVVLEHVIVTGYLDVEVEFDVNKNNYMYEPYRDEFVKIGSDIVILSIKFTLTVNQDKEVELFDIDEVNQA
jgi:hypothetical protein